MTRLVITVALTVVLLSALMYADPTNLTINIGAGAITISVNSIGTPGTPHVRAEVEYIIKFVSSTVPGLSLDQIVVGGNRNSHWYSATEISGPSGVVTVGHGLGSVLTWTGSNFFIGDTLIIDSFGARRGKIGPGVLTASGGGLSTSASTLVPVPEPTTIALCAGGVAVLGWFKKRLA